MFRSIVNSSQFRILLISFSVFLLNGCGALRSWQAKSSHYDTENSRPAPAPEEREELVRFAQRFGLMALFSAAVYRDDLTDPSNGGGCSYREGDAINSPRYGMPPRWERWIPKDKAVHACVDEDGLFYETYIHRALGSTDVDEVVIAFRGTENSKAQIIKDWSSNFAAALGFEPSEYKLARTHMPKLISAINNEFSNKRPIIYATGHSLGGGLAQQLGYMSRDVKEVITFNTTPVTNWSSLRLAVPGEVKNDYPIIYRLEHKGEFLSIPRFIASGFTSTRFNRYDYGLPINKASYFEGHAIRIFACTFAQILASNESYIAEHDFSVDYAKSLVGKAALANSDDKKLCGEYESNN